MAVSCNPKKVLMAETPAQISSVNFWKTPEDVQFATNAMYNSMRYIAEVSTYLDALSDNAYSHYPWEGYQEIALGTHTSTSPDAISDHWSRCYGGIGRANDILANLDRVTMSDAAKNNFRGQALFLRAYFYFMLSDLYGGVPLILEAPKLEQGQLPRNSKEEVVAQVIADLTEAASLLPETASDTGVATSGAAKALKAEVQLYNRMYAAAAATAKEVMDSGKYSLFPDYGGLFREENENNAEVIFDAQFKYPEQGSSIGLYLGAAAYNAGWSSIVPMKSLVEAYEMSNGKPITDPTSGYDPNNPYENRDPRLKQTIFVPGSTYNGNEGFVDCNCTHTYTNKAGKQVTLTLKSGLMGYVFKKYTYYTETTVMPVYTDGGQASGINIIVQRYARVLLNYAEAQNEAAGPDASVADAINMIRRRAGMPDLPAGLSQEAMREAIRYERRAELTLENSRYADLRRWGIARQTLDGFVEKGVSGDGSEVSRYTRRFQDNFNLWPIPGAEFLIKGTQLTQNPGY